MIKLGFGVLLWSITHLFPAFAPQFRRGIAGKPAENAYKLLFTLALILSIYLMISGWKASLPELLYRPPDWGRYAAAPLVLIAFILFLAPYPANNFKRLLRHPQLTGVVFWGAGHLLANGEDRSLLFFGGLTLWALLEMFAINRREGAREPPEAAPIRNDVLLALAGLVLYIAFLIAHRWLFGVAPFAALAAN